MNAANGANILKFGFCQEGINQSYPITYAEHYVIDPLTKVKVNFTKQNVTDVQIRNYDNHIRGFVMNFTSGSKCPTSLEKYYLTVTTLCDKNQTGITLTSSDFSNPCHP